jgi:nicotinate-nucleotide adenylyltransferase
MVGVMGGTFDPIHDGHLRLAEHIAEEFSLQAVVFMPAGTPPHKAGQRILSAAHRLEMTRLASMDNPRFRLSDLECKREGYSYTVDTLERLHQSGSGSLALLLGADSVVQMHQWYQPADILRQAMVIAAPRPDTDMVRLQAAIQVLKADFGGDIRVSTATAMPHASTEIRALAARGRSIRYLVPEPVRRYIEENRLYQSSGEDVP